MTSVFISYSHRDSEIANRLAKDLGQAGIEVWIDEDGLKIGRVLVSGIQEGLASADYLCVLLSEHSVASPWVEREVSAVLQREFDEGEIRVLPVLVGDCDVPAFLKAKLCADFRDPSAYKEQLEALLQSMSVHVTSGLTEVLVDQSYRQETWSGEPTLEAGYSELGEALVGSAHCRPYSSGYQSSKALDRAKVLVLPTPFGVLVDDHEYAQIARWVQRGGGLLVLGIYLMEAHHYNNLNHLLRRLGLEFRHDILMPTGRESRRDCMDQSFRYRDRDLWVVTEPKGAPANHPILDGVNRLGFTSACSVESAETPEFVASTGEQVAVLHAQGHKDPTSGRLRNVTDYILERHGAAPFLVASEHGRGRVLAIGSWKVFMNEFLEDDSLGNRTLLHNSINWLSGEKTGNEA